MKKLAQVLALLALASAACVALAQEGYEAGPIEIYNPGAPTDDAAAQPAAGAGHWTDALTPALKLGLTMLAIGVPMALVVAGRLWRRLPAGERALVLLSWATYRGRGFRGRLRSLAAAGSTARRPISPIAMLLAPRAFDAALDAATRAERAYGVPLRHAVHGFRKG